jgi:DNA-binding response OmpR family regulator
MVNTTDILNANILIVDDQHANVELLEQMLVAFGYSHITSSMDPYAVCALHREHHYDLILLDLQMPGMDGFQVMEGLLQLEIDSYAPILVITAQPGHKLRALDMGAKDFVSKPFDMVELKTRIHNMLEVRLLYKQLEQHNQMLEQVVQARTVDLGESEARFRCLTELSSDWYWEQDASGSFTKTYGAVLEMLAISDCVYDDAELCQSNENELVTLRANIAERCPFLDLVCRRQNMDGEYQYFQVSGEPVFDASGRFTGYRGIGRNVNEGMGEKSIMPI